MTEPATPSPPLGDRPASPSLWPWLALSALSGVLYFVGFAGFDIWPLALVAFVPHLFALERGGTTTRRVIALGFVFGVVTNAGGYYWLVGMLGDFSGFPWPVCVGIAFLLWAYQAGQLTLFSLVFRALRNIGWASMAAAPVAIAAIEWVYPFLFHSYLGNALHNVPVAIQVADLGGPLLVSALIAMVSGVVDDVRRARMLGAPMPWREVVVGAVLIVATLGYGAYRMNEVSARMEAAPPLRVGLIQANMELDLKRLDPAEGLTRHIDQSLALESADKLDLLVWPESAYMYLVPEEQKNLKEYVSGRIRTPLLFGGLAERRGADGKPRFFNTAFLIDGRGDVLGSYDKAYLLPFGEYIPFGETFPSLYEMSPHTGRFVQGTKHVGMPLGGHVIAPLICYEDIIPDFVRRAVNETHAELLVNMTNDAWFGDSTEPWEHLALAKFRAVEHHLYLLRATNSGVSAAVDPLGRVVAQGGVFKRESLPVTVRYMKGATLYQSVGDWPGIGSIALLLALYLQRRRRARRPA